MNKKKSNKHKTENQEVNLSKKLYKWLQDLQVYSYPKAYQTDELIKKFDTAIKHFTQITEKAHKWNRYLIILSSLLLFFTIGILGLGIWQFSILKDYQNWSRIEMSRKPNLSLLVYQTDVTDDNNVLEVHCGLLNTGNDIAGFVQILQPTIVQKGTTHSLILKVKGPSVSTLTQEGQQNVKIPVYQHAEIIYYEEKEHKHYVVKLPWIWEFHNVSSKTKKITAEYTIYYDRGSCDGRLIINNPLYKGK